MGRELAPLQTKLSKTSELSTIILMQDEAEAISRVLARLSGQQTSSYEEVHSSQKLQSLAYLIYKSRRFRDCIFDSSFFSEPAWDLLLAAYCLERTDSRLTVSSLCYSAGCPFSTALRWLTKLEKHGMFVRVTSASDRRVVNITLTSSGREAIDLYFNKMLSNLSAYQITDT